MIFLSVLLAGLLQSQASETKDLEYAFKIDDIHRGDALVAALQHEKSLNRDNRQSSMYISCTNYHNNRKLKSTLEELMDDSSFHPVYFSERSNRVCYTFNSDSASPKLNEKGIRTTAVPHALKIGSEFHLTFDQLVSSSLRNHRDHGTFVMELGLGVGVLGKGLKASSKTHERVFSDLMDGVHSLFSNPNFRSRHIDSFFWTSPKNSDLYVRAANPIISEVRTNRKQQYLQSFFRTCDFSSAQMEVLESHISLTMKLSSSEVRLKQGGGLHPLCVLQLASLASLHSDITHVIFHSAEKILTAQSSETESQLTSGPYDTGLPPTDQNQYVQSGDELLTPYSDLGIDGSGFVLGMIDTGIDDLSCFLVDYSLTPTTRTPGADYANPITESYRRKVIQYITWGDGSPAPDYDHGTWCGGSAIGRCNTSNTLANEYNGIAYNGQITMFDIDIADNFLNVPSLYNIALPPAYGAGARVHSNSWGTPGINTYTSKALDVDRFMFENSDFLFVVAAMNEGDLGYKTVGSPGSSKNALTVGASSYPDHEVLVYFSSIGYDYDNHMIKPNVVTPGTKLMSTGVRNANQTYSCNTQVSSGTSMATPIAAGAAILARHYLENASFWGKFCDTTYRSCPSVVRSGYQHVSGALIKAVLTNSGEGMRATSATSSLPAINLTAPPDVFQGWGQVQLSNVLPIPGQYDFDLYVADYETLTSLTERVYLVDVTDSAYQLRVTIVWTDPVNVMWAAKNLLNDLDLIVTSPLGNVTYGNNITADEFNPVERVVIDNPMQGVWSVTVVAKELAVGPSQTYAVVITSGGNVIEAQTNVDPVPIDESKINYDPAETICYESQVGGAPANQYIRFQLEDWLNGESWTGVDFNVFNSDSSVAYTCNFIPNADLSTNPDNKAFQCGACLPESATYTASVDTSLALNGNGKYMRVAAPQCNGVSLSSLQTSVKMTLSNGRCNACPSGSSLLQALMFSNVTDDDSADYTWYGDAFYQVLNEQGVVVAAGTLLVSDEEADTYCLKNGNYTLNLQDTELWENRKKHAKVIFSSGSANVTMEGTVEVSDFPVGGGLSSSASPSSLPTSQPTSQPTLPEKSNKQSNDDDTPVTESAGFIVGITIGCIAVAVLIGFAWFKYSKSLNSDKDAALMGP